MEVSNCFYRISIKALVLNETRDKFLVVQEEDGEWDLPGGGLDWGTTPHEDLPREISEEMGVGVTWIADNPSYFFPWQTRRHKIWVANVVYETELDSLNFTPSDECVAVRFVNLEDIKELSVVPNVQILAEMFDADTRK